MTKKNEFTVTVYAECLNRAIDQAADDFAKRLITEVNNWGDHDYEIRQIIAGTPDEKGDDSQWVVSEDATSTIFYLKFPDDTYRILKTVSPWLNSDGSLVRRRISEILRQLSKQYRLPSEEIGVEHRVKATG